MRLTSLMSAALIACCVTLAFAEEWVEFASRDDRFTCNFPHQPKVTETTYESEYGANLPARIYSAEDGASRYSMTVVHYNSIQTLLAEKAKTCAANPGTCSAGALREDRWKLDIAGALTYATGRLMQRDVKVTDLRWGIMDYVEGHVLQLTNNVDKSRTYASIFMHENKLYIMEGTVPAGYPVPALFQQSLGWIDENGEGIRYQAIYRNGVPAPPRVNRAGRGQGPGR
jgi:hypothetical protein